MHACFWQNHTSSKEQKNSLNVPTSPLSFTDTSTIQPSYGAQRRHTHPHRFPCLRSSGVNLTSKSSDPTNFIIASFIVIVRFSIAAISLDFASGIWMNGMGTQRRLHCSKAIIVVHHPSARVSGIINRDCSRGHVISEEN